MNLNTHLLSFRFVIHSNLDLDSHIYSPSHCDGPRTNSTGSNISLMFILTKPQA